MAGSVHRKKTRAKTGWKQLQRENPDYSNWQLCSKVSDYEESGRSPDGKRKKLIDHAEPVSDGINFAWYLTFWLTARFGDERSFWKTATPARCDILFKEYAYMIAPKTQRPKEPQCGGSLSQYLMGGG